MNEELLRELGGDIPLMTRSHLRFLNEVNLAVKNAYPNSDLLYDEFYDEEEMVEYVEIVSALEYNLKTIINQLKAGRSARRKFLKIYPQWKKIREDGIEKLREIAQSIQTDRFNVNVSKLVGQCTSLVGGAVTLTSAALIPFTFGLTTPLAIAGGSMTAAGCVTTVGASITETVLLKNKIKSAQEIIEEDKKYFQEMNDWIEHAKKLEEALSEIMSIGIVKDIIESVKELVEKGIQIRNDFVRLNYIQRSLDFIRNVLPENIFQVVPLLSIVTIISVLVTIFLLMRSIENRFVFDCASLTVRSIFGIASLADDVIDVARFTSLFTSNAVLAKDVAKAVTRGAVAVIGMSLDVAGIALTSIDIHNGSNSPQAQNITEASDEMEEEAKLLEEVYESISLVQ